MSKNVEEVDVLVIGSGAGGAPVALRLAEAGASVLVLDKGPRHRPQDFLHDEIAVCRRDYWTPWVQDDPHVLDRGAGHSPSLTNAGWIAQCVGGGTVHMSGFFLRLHPEDFALTKNYGPLEGSTAIDWPIDYEDLAPFYEQVEREVGVSGDVSKNPFGPPRNAAFPYPPVATHPVGQWIDKAATAQGMHAFEMPRAIVTASSEGRGACVYCSLCGSYGCEVHAKSSTLASLIPKAEATGRCVVKPDCMVTRIVMRDPGQAGGAEYVDKAGHTHQVRAKTVVLAASAVESARLLLLSACQGHEAGIGNRYGQVGQNLCFSTLGKVSGTLAYEGRSAEQVAELQSGMPFVGRAVQDYYQAKGVGFGKGGTFHLLWAHPNPIHAAQQLVRDQGRLVFGAELNERMQQRFVAGRRLEVECFGEWLPTRGCNITLDDEATDRWGLPAARISVAQRHASDAQASRHLTENAQTLLQSLDAVDIEVEAVGGETWVLQNGTCRMGIDPNNSVTTSKGNLHEVRNLYVTCGGALPSSGAVPSTLTILANSFRVAAGIVFDRD